MNITPTTIAFCNALFRLQKRLSPVLFEDKDFAGIYEPFEIAPYEWHDIHPALGYHGELAVIADQENPALYRISIHVVCDSTCEVRFAASDIALTSEEVIKVISGRGGRLDPDDSVSVVKRILSSFPALQKDTAQ